MSPRPLWFAEFSQPGFLVIHLFRLFLFFVPSMILSSSFSYFFLVLGAVKKNSQTSDCTRRNVEHAEAKWLMGGRDRSGNRMRRATGATLSASKNIYVNLMQKEVNYIKNRFLSFVYI